VQRGRFEIDVVALSGIAGEVDAAAGTLRETVKAARSRLAPPLRSGSAAAVAAAAAEQVWLADLRRLADQVDAYGAGLAASAREHQVTDQTNAAGLRRSGSESPR
jgi:uncharacterized protein YukE